MVSLELLFQWDIYLHFFYRIINTLSPIGLVSLKSGFFFYVLYAFVLEESKVTRRAVDSYSIGFSLGATFLRFKLSVKMQNSSSLTYCFVCTVPCINKALTTTIRTSCSALMCKHTEELRQSADVLLSQSLCFSFSFFVSSRTALF